MASTNNQSAQAIFGPAPADIAAANGDAVEDIDAGVIPEEYDNEDSSDDEPQVIRSTNYPVEFQTRLPPSSRRIWQEMPVGLVSDVPDQCTIIMDGETTVIFRRQNS